MNSYLTVKMLDSEKMGRDACAECGGPRGALLTGVQSVLAPEKRGCRRSASSTLSPRHFDVYELSKLSHSDFPPGRAVGCVGHQCPSSSLIRTKFVKFPQNNRYFRGYVS